VNHNKNRVKDRPKSDSTLRKMKPKENSDLGIINGIKTGLHSSFHEREMGDER